MSLFHFRNDRFESLDAEFVETVLEFLQNALDFASREVYDNAVVAHFRIMQKPPAFFEGKWNKRTPEGDIVSDMIFHYSLTDLLPIAHSRDMQVDGAHTWNVYSNDEDEMH